MSDDVKALVARLRADAHLPGVAPATALQAADALEAERGHIQSLAKWVGVDESEGSLGIACEVSAALEAALRPPVSPEARGVVVHEVIPGVPLVLDDLGRKAFVFDGCIVSGWPLAEIGEDGLPLWEADSDVGRVTKFGGVKHWIEFPVELWNLSSARFSFSSQPVYDEEKIARVIQDAANRSEDRHPGQTRAEWYAAALIAALRGGELTREETNE